MTELRCAAKRLALDRVRVMGILNITPDSFSDGGRLFQGGVPDPGAVRERALAMLEAGADLLDIGAESTRPGAEQVGEDEELRRLMPVLDALADLDTILSVDTCKPAVARQALAAGVGLINDVTGLRDPGMLEVLAASDAGVCVMHMRGEPRTMQLAPHYDNVVAEVRALLATRVADARAVGISQQRICIDPGFGFGKSLDHNLELLRGLEAVRVDQLPILVGLSRKRMIGTLTGKPVDERQAGSVAAALLAAQRGADIVRVHDVAATVDAIGVMEALAQRDTLTQTSAVDSRAAEGAAPSVQGAAVQ